MFKTTILAYTILAITSPLNYSGNLSLARPFRYETIQNSTKPLASRSISLDNRYDNIFVNGVFKDNILLTLNYMSGSVKNKADIDWSKIEKPGTYQLRLKPGEVFAFHENLKKDYAKSEVKTTNAHFNYQDGFRSDGYLMGDGVCHLASLVYWAAKDAGLAAVAPTNHDFAKINEVPKEYGVSIYYLPDRSETSVRQNLYITNNFDFPVVFVFSFDGKILSLDINKISD